MNGEKSRDVCSRTIQVVMLVMKLLMVQYCCMVPTSVIKNEFMRCMKD